VRTKSSMLTCSEAESAGLSSFLGRAIMMLGSNARASTGWFYDECDSSGEKRGGFGGGFREGAGNGWLMRKNL